MSLISLQADILTEGIFCNMEEVALKPTFLVVDDEEQVRDFIQLLLEGEGYQILTAENGQVALEIYEHFQSEIALVISDIHMPKMDGLQLFSEIKARNPSLTVILMSGFQVQNSAEKLGISDTITVIEKPFSIDILLEAVATVLSK